MLGENNISWLWLQTPGVEADIGSTEEALLKAVIPVSGECLPKPCVFCVTRVCLCSFHQRTTVRLPVEPEPEVIVSRERVKGLPPRPHPQTAPHSHQRPRPLPICTVFELACPPASLLALLQVRGSSWQGGASFHPQFSVRSSLPWT